MSTISPIDIGDDKLIEISVPGVHQGQRLDQFLAYHAAIMPGDFSRAMFQELISQNRILVNGVVRKNNYRVKAEDQVHISVPTPSCSELVPEQVDFAVIHEDKDILVLSKPPGIVVHPACGNTTGTLVHGLLHHCNDLSGINGHIRPGIVHRLDKDTSGVMVIAKNDESHHSLSAQFKNKSAQKIYHALLDGVPKEEKGEIRTLIGRHPVARKKMAVVSGPNGKIAITQWKVIDRYVDKLCWAEIVIATGRTHQIRVHMASIGLPVAGDQVYGRKNPLYRKLGINRQFLHASKLSFRHPTTGEQVGYEAVLPSDMAAVLALLKND